eukprot:GHVS01008082.1.p1 GENE.GHVS01008082.1~~GHVS01008082.1.p1  ORF type:complete len:217 (-),score=8.64 GHVS01008082.1:541-1191(-)
MTIPSSSSLFRRSPHRSLFLPNRVCSGDASLSIGRNSPFWAKPHAGQSARPLQGMDMRKIISCPWVNILATRKPMYTGYQWGHWASPQLQAFSYEDVATYFTQRNTWNEYSLWQMLKLTYPHLRYCLMYVVNLLIAAGPSLAYIFWSQKFEPFEYEIEPDEYFENFRWHYYGPNLDHHAFVQYLEARRAKKWRDPSIEPKEWIPPQYRGPGEFKMH